MATTVDTQLYLRLACQEQAVNDLGVAQQPHLFEFPGTLNPGGNYGTGTTDNKMDVIWSDQRTLVATSEQLDVRGVLTSAINNTALAFIEVRGIFIKNHSATALLVGGGANPAFAGLFGATGDIIKVPPQGLFAWFAPMDGLGLSTTAATADMLTMDSVASTVIYTIVLLGVSA